MGTFEGIFKNYIYLVLIDDCFLLHLLDFCFEAWESSAVVRKLLIGAGPYFDELLMYSVGRQAVSLAYPPSSSNSLSGML